MEVNRRANQLMYNKRITTLPMPFGFIADKVNNPAALRLLILRH